MATSPEKMQQVIDMLKETDKNIGDLLVNSPELRIRASHVLMRLINGFAQATGLGIEEHEVVREEKKPLTHIAGTPINAREIVKPAAAKPTSAEVDETQKYINMAFEDFANEDAETLNEVYDEFTIRGVAVKAGLEVTPTEPETLDLEFIQKVKEAVIAYKS